MPRVRCKFCGMSARGHEWSYAGVLPQVSFAHIGPAFSPSATSQKQTCYTPTANDLHPLEPPPSPRGLPDKPFIPW